MPKFIKCWYRDCDSDNREDPRLMFYKFPKDYERCLQWVNNCSNAELTSIWRNTPDRISTFRVCQRHFLREFLGSSSRLVGHAVPAPYGVPLEHIDARRFMVECASLKNSSNLTRQQRLLPHSQPEDPVPPSDCYSTTYESINNCDDGFVRPFVDTNNIVNTNGQDQPSLTMAMDQADCHQQILNYGSFVEDHTYYNAPCGTNYNETFMSAGELQPQLESDQTHEMTNLCPAQLTDMQLAPHQNEDASSDQAMSTRVDYNSNPKINYDREGRVISIQYPSGTLSMLKSDHNAHIVALKHKVRHYQRRLAVVNHRYQKLRSQMKGRSNRMRLLECLKICRADFDPCIYEIFKRQIKSPASKHGNRWSKDVKTFSSSVYLRSRSAYKFIRKTIDLPSESIVKRYIGENRLSKLSNISHGNEDAVNCCEDVDDPCEVSEVHPSK